jgi:hypothetical protein
MASKFRRGATAYAKKTGNSYVIEDVADGIVYCSGDNGAETEFPEDALFTEAEWAARGDGKRGILYARLKQAMGASAAGAKLDRAAATQVLAKIERLSAGILDFVAYGVATRILVKGGEQNLVEALAIPKCREAFESATPETRIGLVGGILETPPEVLLNAGRLGDNLMRAMIEKGMAANAEAFESFRDRPRR